MFKTFGHEKVSILDDIDFEIEPIGKSSDGNDVFLKDIWPARAEVEAMVQSVVKPELFKDYYS